MAMVKDYLKNSFKHNIDAGKLQYGLAQMTHSTEVAEILATSNYDWYLIDCEHGSNNVQTSIEIAKTISEYNVTPVVRVGEPSTSVLKQLLDGGIQNIIIPKVDTPEEAERIMYWASFPPRGNRGFGATVARSGRYGRCKDYLERSNDEICIILQIESKIGVENLDAIVKTPGVGGIFIGSIDLAIDMGYGLNIFAPEVEEVVERTIKRIRELGLPVSATVATPEQAKRFINLGVSFILTGIDSSFLINAADSALEKFKKGIEG